jgi:hypothetical protein
MARTPLRVRFAWDNEAAAWYVMESDIPGLNAESDTLERLLDKVRRMAPELIALNRHIIGEVPHGEMPLDWSAECQDTLALDP